VTLKLTPHAIRSCETRGLPADVIHRVATAKTGGIREDSDYAVHVGRVPDRGSLVGSNGSEVWAIVRGLAITTIMLRRKDQPSTAAALDVDYIIL